MKLGAALLAVVLCLGVAFGFGVTSLGVPKLSVMKPESVRVGSTTQSRRSRGCGTCIYMGGGGRYGGGGGGWSGGGK